MTDMPETTTPATADLCDAYSEQVQVAAPLFRDYGGTRAFGGPIATVKVHEDNVLVRQALEEPGVGRVLVVDGGGSLRCALVGDNLAALAQRNGWAGIIVYGCIRDARAIGQIALGLKALATHPRKSIKRGAGQRDEAVMFAEVEFAPGHYVYADEDGIIVANQPLDAAS
jgi:regulator of ribonuclease activity A